MMGAGAGAVVVVVVRLLLVAAIGNSGSSAIRDCNVRNASCFMMMSDRMYKTMTHSITSGMYTVIHFHHHDRFGPPPWCGGGGGGGGSIRVGWFDGLDDSPQQPQVPPFNRSGLGRTCTNS